MNFNIRVTDNEVVATGDFKGELGGKWLDADGGKIQVFLFPADGLPFYDPKKKFKRITIKMEDS